METNEINVEALKNSFDKAFKQEGRHHTQQEWDYMKCAILGPKEASHLEPGCIIKDEKGNKIGIGKSKLALLFPREWNQNWSRGDASGVEKKYFLVYLYYYEYIKTSIFVQIIRPKTSLYRFRGGKQSPGFKALEKNHQKLHIKIIEIIENNETSIYRHDADLYIIAEKINEESKILDENLSLAFFEIGAFRQNNKNFTFYTKKFVDNDYKHTIENINKESNIIYEGGNKNMNKSQFKPGNKINKTGISNFIAEIIIKYVIENKRAMLRFERFERFEMEDWIYKEVIKNPKFKDVSKKSVKDALLRTKMLEELIIKKNKKEYVIRSQKIKHYMEDSVKKPNSSICKIIKKQKNKIKESNELENKFENLENKIENLENKVENLENEVFEEFIHMTPRDLDNIAPKASI